MEIYLVGGAVRDSLLNLDVTERDWVVVGATESQLKALGYTRVGKDFPVFLHPKSKEEYALARTERKTAKGHKGFVCDANSEVSLEQDLKRRDLSINAIAKSKDGQLIDPYGGISDLKAGIFRHVSDAFAEDPLRILRVARFSARFPTFEIHADTFLLMQMMVERDDLSELATERIVAEVEKALASSAPNKFFSILNQLGADQKLWPEITKQGIHLLEKVCHASEGKAERMAALLWPLNDSQFNNLATRFKLPKHLIELASLRSTYDAWQNLEKMDAKGIVDYLYSIDAFRRKDRFKRVNQYFGLISRISALPDNTLPWIALFETATSISARDLAPGFSGAALGKALKSAQANEISKLA